MLSFTYVHNFVNVFTCTPTQPNSFLSLNLVNSSFFFIFYSFLSLSSRSNVIVLIVIIIVIISIILHFTNSNIEQKS